MVLQKPKFTLFQSFAVSFFFSGYVHLVVSIFSQSSPLGVPLFVKLRKSRSKSGFVCVFLESEHLAHAFKIFRSIALPRPLI